MHIALISEHASPVSVLGGVDCGGQNVYVSQVAKHLAKLGCDVDVFTRRDSVHLPETMNLVNGVRVIHVPAGPPRAVPKEELLPYMGQFTDYVLRFCRLQRRFYDVIHANFFMSGLVAADIKRVTGIPFVITFHALGRVRRLHQRGEDRFPNARFDIEDRIIAEADGIIAECPQDKEDLIQLYNAAEDRMTMIPCGFDPDELWPVDRKKARDTLNLDENQPVVLHVGRLVPRKGIDNAILGFSCLRNTHGVDAQMLVVGGETDIPNPAENPELRRLMDLVKSEGLEGCVRFVGRRGRSSLRTYYSAADVFVTTPWYEPFGITPVEAMACGTPVVGSHVGGIKYSVRDGECGYTVSPRDPEALGERLAHILNHPKVRRVLGKQARQRANDLFLWKQVAESIYGYYNDVVSTVKSLRSIERQHLAIVEERLGSAIAALGSVRSDLKEGIAEASSLLHQALVSGNKIIVYGSGPMEALHAQYLALRFNSDIQQPNGVRYPVFYLADSDVSGAIGSNRDECYLLWLLESVGSRGDVLVIFDHAGKSCAAVRTLVAGADRLGLPSLGVCANAPDAATGASAFTVDLRVSSSSMFDGIVTVIVDTLSEMLRRKTLRLSSYEQLPLQTPRAGQAKHDQNYSLETTLNNEVG